MNLLHLRVTAMDLQTRKLSQWQQSGGIGPSNDNQPLVFHRDGVTGDVLFDVNWCDGSPATVERQKQVLVIGDYFTRLMESFPLPSQPAEPFAQKMVKDYLTRFGTSLKLHSDQGRNFESQLYKEVLKLLQIKKTRTTSYRPRSNDLIEIFNGTLGRMIMKFVSQHKQD